MPQTISHRALAPLKARFPDVELRAGAFRDMTTVLAPRESLVRVCEFVRDDPGLRYDMLFELNGVDYLHFPGAEHRFAVNYGLLSTVNNSRLWLKVFVDPTRPTGPGLALRDEEIYEKGDPGLKVDSVYGVWPSADWMEREVYDMFGIVFAGHPDLRRILTWNNYGSYPLRKDYPVEGIGERDDYQVVTRDSA